MLRNVPFNKGWLYKPDFKEAYVNGEISQIDEQTEGFVTVTLPHTNLELPFNYFDEKSYQFISTYAKNFDYDPAWDQKAVYLTFGAVMTYAEVYLNDRFLCSHKGGYTPFTVDLNPALKKGSNKLVLKVDSTERNDIPPFGYVVDYLAYGGIYREVELFVLDPLHIDNIKLEAENVLDQENRALKVRADLSNTEAKTGHAKLRGALSNLSGELIASIEKDIELEGRSLESFTMNLTNLSEVELWSVDKPRLYLLSLEILREEKVLDRYESRFGFREARFEVDGFYLNGEKLFIIGLNRHQAYPYVGYAMPERAQKEDADVLKNDLGLNLVRTSHYPQSKGFLDRCDEIGLMVFEEIPGWQHIGDEAWQEVAKENVREMITRDWNHPSIILWGVRINESGDNHAFYTDTNRIAHDLDSTRQTGGVRCYERSEFLEDVYTMNDFYLGQTPEHPPIREPRQSTGLDYDVPYMITEYNGHMFPTKKQDGAERQHEHTLRHARVVDKGASHPNVSGTIGWCAFDYNTHLDFGSGDKICYHGVMDMYRQPKFASYAYRSQKSVKAEPVLEAITVYSRGDKSGGGVVPIMIMSNCDYIKLVINGHESGPYYPDKENFPGLKHAPIIIRDTLGEWGASWSDAELISYVNGEAKIRRKYLASPVPAKLYVKAASEELISNGYDATRVDIRLQDEAGNPLYYTDQVLELSLTGSATLLGPTLRTLTGGSTAVWVRSLDTNESGDIVVKAKAAGFESFVTIRLTAEK